MQKDKNIIAYVAGLPVGAVDSIRAYEKKEKRTFRIMVIVDSRQQKKAAASYPNADIILPIDFAKPGKIAAALLPYQDELLAITCRIESQMEKFADIIPNVPYLRTPSTESLEWATDKLKMRRRFALYDKQNTPAFASVKNNTKAERKRLIEKVGFPMIVKPANLAQSLLVTVCYHEEELDKALRNAFRRIKKTYGDNGRTKQEPKLMVEAYMEGEMYSVEAYVNGRGAVTFCPLVKVITGMNIGHQDFYNYMHITPTGLKKSTIERAQAVAKTGIHALGLKNTTAHVELMKLDDEWKIIEIGPRVGGFRHKLHALSCDIDHSLNDVLIRIPKRPVVPKKCKGYAATLKWYPEKEGTLVEMKGIKKIRELKSFSDMVVNKKLGDRCYFAKNGGKAVFTVTLYNKERSKLLADIRRVEQWVKIKVK